MTKEIVVAFCFDKGYANYAAVSTFSLIKNSKSCLKIYWVIPKGEVEYISKIKNYLNKKSLFNIEILLADIEKFSKWKIGYHFTAGMYLRLMLPNLINLDKIIYLDADTIIQRDLAELFNIDLKNNFIAGVLDPAGEKTSKVSRSKNDPYINSGVTLINLNEMRLDGSLEKSIEIYKKFESQIAWPDQCIMNKYTEGKKLILDSKWNRQVFSNSIDEDQFRDFSSSSYSSILHFVGSVKPWQKWCNPCVTEFWMSYASHLDIPTLKLTEIETIDQAMVYAQVLDLNKKFEEASKVKTNIINGLYNYINSFKK